MLGSSNSVSYHNQSRSFLTALSSSMAMSSSNNFIVEKMQEYYIRKRIILTKDVFADHDHLIIYFSYQIVEEHDIATKSLSAEVYTRIVMS